MQITHELPHNTQIRVERKKEKKGGGKPGRDSMTSDVSNLENESPSQFMQGCKQGPSLLLQEPLNCDTWTKDGLSGNVRIEVVRFPVLCSHLG